MVDVDVTEIGHITVRLVRGDLDPDVCRRRHRVGQVNRRET